MINECLRIFSRNEWEHHVITPKSRKPLPVEVKETQGLVSGAENLLTGNHQAARLEFPVGGVKPFVILDLGSASPGGYPVFKIKSAVGTPVLRLAYSDVYDYIMFPETGERGDSDRGSCKYLGVELPVPPANPYRYELYTITAPGVYAAPLVQGQQKWVRLQLDTEGTTVEVECFYIVNVSDMSPHEGFFLCNDDDITRLWYASTYTAQIASFPNANAWEIIEGWLAPRALAKSNDVGLCREGSDWSDYDFEFDFKIMKNPGPVSAVGWVLRAADADNGYVFQIDLDSRMHVRLRKDGVYRHLKEPFVLPVKMADGVVHRIKAVARGGMVSTYLDGRLVDETTDNTYCRGRVGFCQPLDKWAFVRNIRVSADNGHPLLADDCNHGLDQWDFRRTLAFVADGAKRDRLPWIGDLDWAGRNVYYGFRNLEYMKDSLRMFAFNQTPEGYVWATCYPENSVRPKIGEYGYYQSDIFSAWFVPTVADYVLFSGDVDFAKEMYGHVKKDVDYLWSYVEGDGIFCQRYDTSKGLWSHQLEQVGRFAYHNVLICDAMNEAAFIADFTGKRDDAAEFRLRAAVIRDAIMKFFWSDTQGVLLGEIGGTEPCYMTNALALAIRFFDDATSAHVGKYLQQNDYNHGKIISLTIRGHYEYGMDDLGIGRLRIPRGKINWLDTIKDWQQPCTTTECMFDRHLSEGHLKPGSKWGDLSHPDTAMAHILTGYMLGVQPDAPGFARYHMIPHTHGLTWAKGSVPIPGGGDIQCGWHLSDGGSSYEAVLESPAGTEAVAGVPMCDGEFTVSINGRLAYDTRTGFSADYNGRRDARYVYIDGIKPGRYEIVRRPS